MRTPRNNCVAELSASEASPKEIMLISNQKELKTFVSALRRELSGPFAAAKAPGYNQMLDVVAKALGYDAAPAILSKLPKEASAPDTPKVFDQLLNKAGELDLVPTGAAGSAQLVDGLTFEPMQGTLEDIPGCVAYVNAVCRDKTGRVKEEFEGTTEVNWDGQTTRRTEGGFRLWVDEAGNGVSEAMCIMVPENFDPEDENLPLREVLLAHYYKVVRAKYTELSKFIEQAATQANKLFDALAEDIGFALHEGEKRELLARLVR